MSSFVIRNQTRRLTCSLSLFRETSTCNKRWKRGHLSVFIIIRLKLFFVKIKHSSEYNLQQSLNVIKYNPDTHRYSTDCQPVRRKGAEQNVDHSYRVLLQAIKNCRNGSGNKYLFCYKLPAQRRLCVPFNCVCLGTINLSHNTQRSKRTLLQDIFFQCSYA